MRAATFTMYWTAPTANDAPLRPNQIFALSLQRDLLPMHQARSVLKKFASSFSRPTVCAPSPRKTRAYIRRSTGRPPCA